MQISMEDLTKIAGVITASIGLVSLIYAIITKLIIGPMIDGHIKLLAKEIDDRYITRNEMELLKEAADEKHKQTIEEIRDIWVEINLLKRSRAGS